MKESNSVNRSEPVQLRELKFNPLTEDGAPAFTEEDGRS